jgi:hypothetical protein
MENSWIAFAIVGAIVGWTLLQVVNNWIRARHGFEPESMNETDWGMFGGGTDKKPTG